MKKQILTLLIIFMACAAELNAQELPELDASPADISIFRPNGDGTMPVVRVIYGRPQKKGRTMLGGIEPFGRVWRTGANETTEIQFFKDVMLGDKKLSAGTYSLYSIPNKAEWTIILNSRLNTWGAFEYDEAKDVARVKVTAGKSTQAIEAFTITFEGSGGSGNMILAWENALVKVPIKY